MKKYIFLFCVALLFLGGLSAFQYLSFQDGKLHIIFCDVGQGDGILLRTPSGKLVVVDGGPDEKILDCFSRHTPFWQRSISLMILSHPHADHLNGLVSLLDRYNTKYFATERLVNKTTGYETLQEILRHKGVSQKVVYVGDSMMLSDGVKISVLSPSEELLMKTSPNGVIGERAEFANLILLITYKEFTTVLSGDSQALAMEEAARGISPGINVLHVPHHGSATGLSEEVLALLQPKIAVISVGKNNYGHPAPYTTDLLKRFQIPIRTTIEEGDIEIVSDGKSVVFR